MSYGYVDPISSYNSNTNSSVYSNPEYLRLMMTQMSIPNLTSGSDDDKYDPFGGGSSAFGGITTDFYSELIKANTAPQVSPQAELTRYGGLVGKNVTAVYNNKDIKGQVENVYLKGKSVMITVSGIAYPSNVLNIYRIE